MENRVKNFVIAVILVFSLGITPSSAQYGTGAYNELGAQDTTIDKISDWFATLGRSEKEKAVAKSRRRAARRFKKNRAAVTKKRKEILKKKKEAIRQYNARENK